MSIKMLNLNKHREEAEFSSLEQDKNDPLTTSFHLLEIVQ